MSKSRQLIEGLRLSVWAVMLFLGMLLGGLVLIVVLALVGVVLVFLL